MITPEQVAQVNLGLVAAGGLFVVLVILDIILYCHTNSWMVKNHYRNQAIINGIIAAVCFLLTLV